jgi:hypothetical protein
MATIAHAPVASTLSAAAPVKAANVSTRERAVMPDPGPWLFVVAPVSFALTLGTVIYFAVTSF